MGAEWFEQIFLQPLQSGLTSLSASPWGRWCSGWWCNEDALRVRREDTDFCQQKVSKLLSVRDSDSNIFHRAAARGEFYFSESRQWWHSQLCLQADFRLLGSRWVQIHLQANCESVGMTFKNEYKLVKLGNGHFFNWDIFCLKNKVSYVPPDFDEVSCKMLKQSIFIFLLHSSWGFHVISFIWTSMPSFICVCVPPTYIYMCVYIYGFAIMQMLAILNFIVLLLSCTLKMIL